MPRGSKPGERRGGRKKGTPNNAKVRVAEIMARAVASAAAEGRKWTPLEWMLYVLNHPDTSPRVGPPLLARRGRDAVSTSHRLQIGRPP